MSNSKQDDNWGEESTTKENDKPQEVPVIKSDSNPRNNISESRPPRDMGPQRENRDNYPPRDRQPRYDDRPPRDGGFSRGPRDGNSYESRNRSFPNRDGGYSDAYPPRDDGYSRGPRNDNYYSRDRGYGPRDDGYASRERSFDRPDRYDSRDGPRFGDRPPRDYNGPHDGYRKRRFDEMAPYEGGDRPFGRVQKKIREDPAEPNETIGIFNLSFGISLPEFEDYFNEKLADLKGKFTSKLIFNRQTNQCKGFGFLTFDDIADAVKAKQLLEGGEINGQAFRAAYSVKRQEGARDYSGGRRQDDGPRNY